MSKHLFFTTEQPVGRFYVTNINAEILIPISQSKTRDPYNSTGIQRVVNEGRVREISEYCKYPNAMFPTPIILSGKSKYFKFYNLSNEELVDLVESRVGEDLQMIRINGSVVGAMVGILLYLITFTVERFV